MMVPFVNLWKVLLQNLLIFSHLCPSLCNLAYQAVNIDLLVVTIVLYCSSIAVFLPLILLVH